MKNFGGMSLSIFKRLLGGLTQTAEPEKLDLQIPEGWHISDNELDGLLERLPSDQPVFLKSSKDEMDDARILVLSIPATEFECEDLEDAPCLVFRARSSGMTKSTETYIYFKDKFFWGRGRNPTVKMRFDADPATTCSEREHEYGTTKASLHFENLGLLQNAILKDKLFLQLKPEKGYGLTAKFDFTKSRDALVVFATAVMGQEFRQIATVNCEIVNFILRYGPQNVLLKKRALNKLGFNPGRLDYSKEALFYIAAQRYAESRQSYEIVGAVYEGIARTPWHMALYQEAPRRLKAEMGPLKISD